MANEDDSRSAKASVAVLLVEHVVVWSIAHVEAAIARWRTGQEPASQANLATSRHLRRVQRALDRVNDAISRGEVSSLLRDALDLGIIDRARFIDATDGVPPEEVAPTGAFSDDGDRIPGKRDLVEDMMRSGPVSVSFDARRPGVVMDPADDATAGVVTASLAIGDEISIDDRGVSGRVALRSGPARCEIPWSAVFAARPRLGPAVLWREDAPSEIYAATSLDRMNPTERRKTLRLV